MAIKAICKGNQSDINLKGATYKYLFNFAAKTTINRMLRKLSLTLLILGSFVFFISCKSSGNAVASDDEKQKTISATKAGPPVIIYKTTGKYYSHVPVGLSPDKTKIVSCPGPKDLFYKGGFSYPTLLENGYFLDNRGIDENSAFLKFTYEEYGKFEKSPSTELLFENILDNDPFSEMYYCGSRFDFKDIEKELNDIISGGNLKSMKKLK